MITNTDITIFFYNNGQYNRRIFHNVFLDYRKESAIESSGLVTIGTVSVIIPYANAENLVFDTGKDLLIHGIVDQDIDTTSAQSISESISSLKSNYEVRIIKHCSPRLFGSKHLWHYALTCQ